MFLYEKQRTIINLDAVKDIFPGREPGTLAVSFMSGITSKISVYSSEVEAKKAIEMIAEQMATRIGELPQRTTRVLRILKTLYHCWT